MTKRVRVYIEGGAEGRVADSAFRKGWKKFLIDLHQTARANGYHSLEIIRGRGRAETFRRFTKHKSQYPNDLCVLLVDSETQVPEGANVWDVVKRRAGDNWSRPSWASEQHLYLMVAFVETWLLTDQEALQKFFKRGFDVTPLPTDDLEKRSKADINRALGQATKRCGSGYYRHGQAHEIIEYVNPMRVQTLRHGRRLFEGLSSLIRDQPRA